MMKKVRRFFGQFDMFAAPPTLRAKQEKQSSSLFSGVISFGLALLFCYVFITQAIKIFTYMEIKSVQTQSKLSGADAKAEDIFFALRVGYLSSSDSERYFDIGYYVINKTGNFSFPFKRCTLDQWQKLGQQAQKTFQQFSLSQFYCPQNNEHLDLEKVYYASQPKYIVIYIRPCTSHTKCANQTEQKQFVKNLSDVQGAIFSVVYFLQQVIKPQQRIPVSYILNSDVQLAFTTKRGIIATIQIASFKIYTDVGYTPVEQPELHQGNFVNSFRQTSIQLDNAQDNYAFIYISMNRRFIYVERQVGKIDEMLSYAGGLFSLIVTGLSLFMKSYNQYRYELMVAQGVFHEDQFGNRIRQNQFTYLKYIKYVIFDWVNLIFCTQLDWQECRATDNARDEANCHLDVTRLFRKIQAIDNSLLEVLTEGEKDCLTLIKPNKLLKIKRKRLVLDYYDTIVQGKDAQTIQEKDRLRAILNYALKLGGQNDQQNDIGAIHNEDISRQNLNDQTWQQDLEENDRQLFRQLNRTKKIGQQASKIQISQDFKEIEQQIASQFFKLKPQLRKKIQRKIPVIILHRLVKYRKTKMGNEKKTIQFKGRRKRLPPLNQLFFQQMEMGNKQMSEYQADSIVTKIAK